jgi:hypothetical protein
MYVQSQFVTQQIDEELRIETIFGCPSKIAIALLTDFGNRYDFCRLQFFRFFK